MEYNENIIRDFQELLKHKESSDFNSKLGTLILKNNITTEEQMQKLLNLVKDSSDILKEYQEVIENIQLIKYTTIETFEKLKEVIESNLESNKDDPKLYEKYVWLREYLNRTIQSVQDIEYLGFIQKYQVKDSQNANNPN